MVVHFDVSREKSIAAIQEAMAGDQKIFLVAQRSIETDDPIQEDVYEVGTVGTIKQIMKLPKHIVRVLVSGETRGILKQLQQDTPYLRAEVEVIDESDLVIQDDLNGEAMARSLKDTFLDYAARNGKMSKEAVAEILEIKSLKKLVDEIAANTPFIMLINRKSSEKWIFGRDMRHWRLSWSTKCRSWISKMNCSKR